mmetsp:Transcript_104591/g.295949  ORF Transcript_104591/g.295949 Transcript_104591/m.295949 type:complete len:182 (-) Transcript_104591:55-600(-)
MGGTGDSGARAAPCTGGEGRRRLAPKQNMDAQGASAADPRGIETLKLSGEGRKYFGCNDHVMEQKRELEAFQQGLLRETPRPLKPGQHISSSHLAGAGVDVSDPDEHGRFGARGDRKKRIQPHPDHMTNLGVAADDEAGSGGRKHIDRFAGSRAHYGEALPTYQSTWKRDPYRLRGTSQVC